jgi:hypothetical protein
MEDWEKSPPVHKGIAALESQGGMEGRIIALRDEGIAALKSY